MSDQPRDITLERVNRLTQALADMAESNAAQGRAANRQLAQIIECLTAIETRLTGLAADVHTLGNRVEDFVRALRLEEEIEDQ